MNYLEYATIIEKTAVYPKDKAESYLVHGLCGEAGEFIRAWNFGSLEQKCKELGDVWWYLTALAIHYNLIGHLNESIYYTKLAKYPSSNTIFLMMFEEIGVISEQTKKYLRDGTEVSIFVPLERIANALKALGDLAGLSLEVVWQTNYDKLMKRRQTNTLHGSGDNREEQVA